ncbi:MAG: hypothetical protein WCW14_04055 [Candidatus Paceibacterota bacterium]|jgi:hypothetical protein
MEKDVPGWLKNSAQALNGQSTPDNKLHISNEADEWNGLVTEVTSYVERWNHLQINRIFGDVSEHIFHDSYSHPQYIRDTEPRTNPGNIYVQDTFGSSDLLEAYSGKPEGLTRKMFTYCKALKEKGHRPNDFVFGRIENTMFHKESHGTGDDKSWDDVTDYIVIMDKDNLSLVTPKKEVLFSFSLESLKTFQDLETNVDVFFAQFIENRRLASERKANFQTRKDKLFKLSKELQIPSFLNTLSQAFGRHEEAFLNVDPSVDIQVPETVREWSNNEDMLVIKMTVGCTLLNQRKTERQSLCYVLLTSTGRLGVPLASGNIQTIDAASVPAGGQGFEAVSQINKDLEELITNAYKNPPFVRNVPHIETSGY